MYHSPPIHTLCVKWLLNTTSNVIVFQHHFEHGWSTIQSLSILNIFYLSINKMYIMASSNTLLPVNAQLICK